MAVVLVEPFDNLTAWTLGSAGSIITTGGGVVGNFARVPGSGNRGFPYPAPQVANYIDIDFWWRISVTGGNRSIIQVRSDTGSTNEILLRTNAGPFEIVVGGAVGSPIGNSGAFVPAINTWYHLHLVVLMATAAGGGYARLDVDGVTRINVTGVTTYNTTPLAAQVLILGPGTGTNNDYDEMVIANAPSVSTSGSGAITFAGSGTARVPVNASGSGAITFAGSATAVVTFLGGTGGIIFAGHADAIISPVIVTGTGALTFGGRGDVDIEPRLDVYAPPEWSWLVLRPDGTPLGPLTAATARKLTLLLDGSATATFTMPAAHPETAAITELATDLYVARNGRAMFRGRIGGSSETHAAATDVVNLTAIDYRGMLDHRLVWPTSRLEFAGVDQADIAWQLIADTQALDDLGITRGVGGVTGVLRDRTYTAGLPVGQQIKGLADVADGFDWEVDAHLAFNIYCPERGRYPADVPTSQPVLTYGRDVVSVTTTVDPSKYANAVYFTGSKETEPAPTVGTVDPDTGRWELQKADPNATLQATVDEEAAGELDFASSLPSAISVTLAADVWNPYLLWLGDRVRAVIAVGRLDIDVRRRIVQIDVTLDDTGVETVVLAVGAAPPKLSDRLNNLQKQISQLQLAHQAGGGGGGGGGGGDGGDGGIKRITSVGGTILVENPTGPTTNLEVASHVGRIVVTNEYGPTVNLEYVQPGTDIDTVVATYHVDLLHDLVSFHEYGFYSFAGADTVGLPVAWLKTVPNDAAMFVPEVNNGQQLAQITQPGDYTLTVHVSTISPATGRDIDRNEVVFPVRVSFYGIYPWNSVPSGFPDQFIVGAEGGPNDMTIVLPTVHLHQFDIDNPNTYGAYPIAGFHIEADIMLAPAVWMHTGASIILTVIVSRIA